MKIIILGHLRTRSSYLLSTLCNHYNLENKWEPYDDFARQLISERINNSPDQAWPYYREKILGFTENFRKQDNFVIKLFSMAFFNSYKLQWNIYKNKPFLFDKNDMLEFDKDLSIKMYDKIYFLTRKNYVDNACSYLFGESTQLLFQDFQKDKQRIKLSNKPRFLHYAELNLQMMIRQNMLLPVFEKKLIETSLPYTKLDYEDVPQYINNNYPNTSNIFVEPKFDYKYLIKNYDEIVDKIEKEKLKFQPVVDDLLSQ